MDGFGGGGVNPNWVPSVLRCPKPARLQTTQGNGILPINANVSPESRAQTPRMTSLGTTAQLSQFQVQTGPISVDARELLNSEAQISWPRQIHLVSADRRPFDAVIAFTAGGGLTGYLEVTASGGAVTVYLKCKTLRIRVANWDAISTNRVLCAVENGLGQQTQDLHSVKRDGNDLDPGATVTLPIPPYARHVQVATDGAGENSGLQVELLSPRGPLAPGISIMQAFFASDGPVAVGAASSLRIRNLNPGTVGGVTADFILGWQ